jgi:hypothetical protein
MNTSEIYRVTLAVRDVGDGLSSMSLAKGGAKRRLAKRLSGGRARRLLP